MKFSKLFLTLVVFSGLVFQVKSVVTIKNISGLDLDIYTKEMAHKAQHSNDYNIIRNGETQTLADGHYLLSRSNRELLLRDFQRNR